MFENKIYWVSICLSISKREKYRKSFENIAFRSKFKYINEKKKKMFYNEKIFEQNDKFGKKIKKKVRTLWSIVRKLLTQNMAKRKTLKSWWKDQKK